MRQLYLVFLAFASCGNETLGNSLSTPNADSPGGVLTAARVSFEPSRAVDQVEPVTAIDVELASKELAEASPYVVEGGVSQASLAKLALGQLTSAVSDHIVTSAVHVTDRFWRIRPVTPLTVGVSYSVVSRYGLHGVFRIGSGTGAPLKRVWPPQSSASFLGIYCGPVAPTSPAYLHIDGSEVRALLLPGLNQEGMRTGSCVRLAWGMLSDSIVQPPAAFAQFAFDPAPLAAGVVLDASANVECATAEVPFGPGCASPQPGYLIVRPPMGDFLWALAIDNRYHLQPTANGQSFVIPELGLQ